MAFTPITDGDWEPYAWPDGYSNLIGPLKILKLPEPHRAEVLRLGFVVEDKHCNRMGICHGGMLISLADNALGLNANIMSGTDAPTPTISLSSDFLSSAHLGDWVESRVKVLHITRSMCFVEGSLINTRGILVRCNAIFKRPRLGAPSS